MEDVRMSNFAFAQTKVADILTFYFSMIGIGFGILASELNEHYSKGEKESDIRNLWIISNVSTIPLILSIMMSYFLYMRWMKAKKIYTDLDNL